RKPQDQSLIRDRVRRDDEQLDQEREPQLALRSLEHSKLGDKTARTCQHDWSDAIFRCERLFDCFSHEPAADYSMFATNSRVAFIDALNENSRQHCHSEPFSFAQDRLRKESLIISYTALNDNQRCFASLNMTG